MLQWWLNLRWASDVHAEALAKIDVAIVLLALTLITAVALRG